MDSAYGKCQWLAIRQGDSGRGHQYLILALLMVLAAAVRLFWLDHPHLWMDEIFTWVYTRESYAHHFALSRTSDLHPPLHTVMLKGWISLFGESRVAMRMLSVLFGVFTLPAIYLIARYRTNPRIAVIACLFLALNPMNVHYSREARAYAALSFFLLWAIYFFLALVRERQSRTGNTGWLFAGFAVCLAMTFHLHYLSVLFFPLFGLAALVLSISQGDRRLFVQLAGATALAALLCIPQSVHFFGYATQGGSWRNAWMPATTWAVFYSQTVGAYPFPSIFKLLVVPIYLFGAWRLWHLSRPLFIMTIIFVVIGPLLFAMVSLVRPLYLVRSIQCFTLLSPLLLAVALAGLPNRWLALASGLLAALHLWALGPDYHRERHSNAGEIIKQALAGQEENSLYFDANLRRELTAYRVDLNNAWPIDLDESSHDAPVIARHLSHCADPSLDCPPITVIIEDRPLVREGAGMDWRRALDELTKAYPPRSDRILANYRIVTFE